MIQLPALPPLTGTAIAAEILGNGGIEAAVASGFEALLSVRMDADSNPLAPARTAAPAIGNAGLPDTGKTLPPALPLTMRSALPMTQPVTASATPAVIESEPALCELPPVPSRISLPARPEAPKSGRRPADAGGPAAPAEAGAQPLADPAGKLEDLAEPAVPADPPAVATISMSPLVPVSRGPLQTVAATEPDAVPRPAPAPAPIRAPQPNAPPPRARPKAQPALAAAPVAPAFAPIPATAMPGERPAPFAAPAIPATIASPVSPAKFRVRAAAVAAIPAAAAVVRTPTIATIPAANLPTAELARPDPGPLRDAAPLLSDGPMPAMTVSQTDMAASAVVGPHDFATLVDRLIAAREAAGTQPVSLALDHAEFGKVSLRFEQGEAGLTVAMTSPDPDFARAVSAAIPAEPAFTDEQRPPAAHSGSNRQEPGGTASSDTLSQPRGGSGQDRRDDRGTLRANPGQTPRGRDEPSRRSGIFA